MQITNQIFVILKIIRLLDFLIGFFASHYITKYLFELFLPPIALRLPLLLLFFPSVFFFSLSFASTKCFQLFQVFCQCFYLSFVLNANDFPGEMFRSFGERWKHSPEITMPNVPAVSYEHCERGGGEGKKRIVEIIIGTIFRFER